MALRKIFDGGYTNYGLGSVHPNGTVFAAFQNKAPRWQVEIWKRTPEGRWDWLKTYTDGVDFNGAAGISQCLCLPNGDLLVLIPISDSGSSVDPFEDVLPGHAPAFTPGAVYQYPISANDTVARSSAQAAVEAAQRAEQAAQQAKAQVKIDGAKVEKRIDDVVKVAQLKIASTGISVDTIKAVINGELNNSSQLAAFVWSKAQDAAWAQLQKMGLIKK